MSKKTMKMPAIFPKQTKQAWYWPASCKHPKTLSFRGDDDAVFKTVNAVFQLDDSSCSGGWFTSDADSTTAQLSSASASLESIIRSVRSSERLFVDATSSSVLHAAGAEERPPLGSEAVALESEDPYEDFKKSMEEMVVMRRRKVKEEKKKVEYWEWEWLEELLGWYLRMNPNPNHPFIVAAFLDLLLAFPAHQQNVDEDEDEGSDTTYSTADSCFCSSPDL